MLDLFGFPNINAFGQKYQIFDGNEPTAVNMQIFNVPRGASFLYIYAIGAGGGGGGGLNDLTSTSRGGGGGGATGSRGTFIIPTLLLPEQQIGIRCGKGGDGGTGGNPANPGLSGTSTTLYIPSNQLVLTNIVAGGGGAAGTSAGTASGGSGGGTPTAGSQLNYGITGFVNGSAGGAGGAIAGASGAAGPNISGSWIFSPGGGGGSIGTDNVAKAGGPQLTAASPFPTNQGQAYGSLMYPWYLTGGGGGQSLDGVALDGRKGSYASGGGGGGGGQSGGNGANGGPGFVVIAWW